MVSVGLDRVAPPEEIPGGHPLEHHGRRLNGRNAVGKADEPMGRNPAFFRIGAHRQTGVSDPIPRGHLGHAATDGLDDPGPFHAGRRR